MEENIMPVSRASFDEGELEEERRLMYVAVTRAKERLYLTRSKSRYLYGKREMTLPSRFIDELSPVLGAAVQRSPYESYARRIADVSTSRGYAGYSTYGRRFSRERSRDEEDYGYQSDLPPEPAPSASAFHAAAAYRQAIRPSAAAGGAEKDYTAFKAGVKVRHPKFGEGMIVGTKGQGSALVVSVSFPGLGIKALSAQLAPLTIL